MTTILVPVKNFAVAKQRLASVLSAEQRSALAAAMLRDVLAALSLLEGRVRVALVTADPEAAAMGRRAGFEIVADPANTGETDAISMATEAAIAGGSSSVLVIPGDVPLVSAAEIRTILDSAPGCGAVLVPAFDGRGTNAILRSPPDLFPARFGNDSFLPHFESARRAGGRVVVLQLPGIAVDVDMPEDLARVAAGGDSTYTQQLLHSWEKVAAPATAQL